MSEMNIEQLLLKLNIEHECKGNVFFNTLGLVSSDIDKPFCTFISESKYIDNLSHNASVVLIKKEFADKVQCAGLCFVRDPRRTFFELHNYLSNNREYVREDKSVTIGKNTKINKLANIAEKNIIIGDNVTIEEFVSIKENTVIGNNCIIRAGSVIGGEGFEFKRDCLNNLFGIIHLGGVILKNNVEIQQSSCVDKAVYPWDDTVIEEYSKIDNLVHIAHSVKIGRNTMVIANSGIGGRTIIGNNCWIGFGTTIRNGILIGDNARVNMGAVVTKNVGNDEAVSGNFAIPHKIFLENLKKLVNNN